MPSFSAADRGHTAGHYTRASRGLMDMKPRKKILCNPCFEKEIKLYFSPREELLLGCVVTSMPNPGTLSALIAVPVKLVLLEMEFHAQVNNPKDSICIGEWI